MMPLFSERGNPLENNMPDNLKRRGPEDPNKINVNQDWEIKYWCEELNVSRAKLIRAVEKVGPMVKDVKAYLARMQEQGYSF
jgi:hypothetical protein